MKKVSAVVMMLLFGLLSANLYAAEKDAAGCKDHPLISRIQGYYIRICSNDVGKFDISMEGPGDRIEAVSVQGKSSALLYNPQPELKAKPSEAKLRSDFENTVKKQGGKVLGVTVGQQWPVYKMDKDGKESWVVLMITSGEYYDGSYGYRIIEK